MRKNWWRKNETAGDKQEFIGNRKKKFFNKIKNDYWKYAETPRSPWQEEGRGMRKEKEPSRQKKGSRSLSVVTIGVTTPKSFLIVVEAAMRLSLDDALANLSTSSSRLFY